MKFPFPVRKVAGRLYQVTNQSQTFVRRIRADSGRMAMRKIRNMHPELDRNDLLRAELSPDQE